MSIHENKQEGINNGIRWKYEESFNKKIYQGLLYSEHQLIGNSELRLVLEEECPSPHYLWYFLSDFFIHSEHKMNTPTKKPPESFDHLNHGSRCLTSNNSGHS